MTQDILITPGSGEPQILFRGSGTNDTPIELNVLSSYQSATGSGTALVFEGQEGQLFAVTDNLSSGTIFSVGDITGLSMLSVDASGDVKLGEFANSVIVYPGLTLDDNVPSTTSNVLYNDGGDLMWNGVTVIQSGAAQAVDGSGTASYVARFTDTNTLGTGIIYDNGTNVGIGTASPSTKLHVYSAGQNPGMILESDSTAGAWIKTKSNQTGAEEFQFGTNNTGWHVYNGTDAAYRLSIVNGGNVGIGTSFPASKLHVADGLLRISHSSASPTLELKRDGYNTWEFLVTNTNLYIEPKDVEGDLYFRDVNGTTSLQIDNSANNVYVPNGNVGIGTASPNRALHLYSSDVTDFGLQVESTAGNSSVRIIANTTTKVPSVDFYGTSTRFGRIGIDRTSNIITGLSKNDMFVTTTESSNKLHLATNNISRVTVDSSGNVGIGTTSPTQNLDIRYPAGGGMALLKSTDTTDGLLLGDMAYSVSNTQQGIKHVAMTGIYDYMMMSDGLTTYISSKSNGGEVYLRAGGSNTASQIRLTSTEVSVNDYGSNLDFRVESNNDAYALFVDGVADNVGLGTGSPSSKLSVVDTGTSNIPVVKLDVTGTASYVHSQQALAPNITAGQAVVNFIGRAASSKNAGYIGYLYSGSAGSDDNKLTFGHWSSNHLMVLDGAGKLGIGTTSPSSKLHVQGSSDQLRLSDGTLAFTVGYDNNYLRFKTSAGDTPVVVNWNTGNVGIGSTSPSQKLQVSGNFRLTGAFYDSNNAAGTSGQVLSSTATGTDWISLSEIQGVDGTGSAGQVAFWSDADTITGESNLYWDSANNRLGINTSNPSSPYSLHVNGYALIQAGTQPTLKIDALNTSSPSYTANIELNGYGGRGQGIFFKDKDYANEEWFMGIPYQGYFDKFQIGYDSSGGQGEYLANAFVTVNYDGNVGIGTASPNSKLTIDSGDIRFTTNGQYGLRWPAGSRIWEQTGSTGGVSRLLVSPNGDRFDILNAAGSNFIAGFHADNTTSPNSIRLYKGTLIGSNYAGGSSSPPSNGLAVEGNVGIGTTSPQQKLHIDEGNIRIEKTTDPTIEFNNGSANRSSMFYDTSEETFVLNHTDADANQLVLTSGNNVGIGTNDPNATLHVYSATSGENVFNVEGTNGSLFGVTDNLSGVLMSVNTIAGLPVLEVNSDYSVTAGRFNQNDFVISSSGNVGIGTTTPRIKLNINGGKAGIVSTDNSYGQFRIGNTEDNEASIGFFTGLTESTFGGNPTAAHKWAIGLDVYGIGTNKFGIGNITDATSVFTIQEGGNVGIGTTSPSEKLHVYGTAAGDGALIGNVKIGRWEGNADYAAFTHDSVHSTSTSYALLQNSNGDSYLNTAAYLNFRVNNVNSMQIYPDKSIKMYGDSTNTTWTSASPTLAIKRASSSPYISFHADTGGRLGYLQFNNGINTLNVETYNDFIIRTNSLERMTVSKDGYVDFSNYIRIDNTNDTRGIVFEDYASNDSIYMTVNDGQGNFNIMLGVNHSGNRILTGDGLSKILLSGHGRQGEISLNAGQTGTAGASAVYNIGLSLDSTDQKLRIGNPNDNTGLDDQAGNIIADVDGDLITRYLRARDANGIQIGDDSDTLGIFVKDGGNVGIGTASPSEKLHVVGDQRIENATDPKLEFHDGAAVGGYVKFDTSEDNLVLSHVDVAGDNQIALANDGNVGIGTASPNAVLHAYGSTPSGTVFNVEGTNGSLFSVVDNLSGVLMSVNNNAGLPVFEVNDDDSIVGGRFAQNDLVVTTSGDIGMGTANPASKLEVNGTVTATSFSGAGTGLTGTAASLTAGAVTNGVYTTGNQTVGGVKTFSSQIISTAANNAANGGGQIYLSGAAGNRIDFNNNGAAAPSFTTRSVGTKIVLYPGIGASSTDYAIGIESSTQWYSVPSLGSQFKWYAATTNVATLTGGGVLTVSGGTSQINVDNLRLDGNTLSSTNTNGNIIITPNGTGGIAAGASATVTGQYAVVGGGLSNTASSYYATVGGGAFNCAADGRSTVSGGTGNTASGYISTIGGGAYNCICSGGSCSTIGGGFENTASAAYSTVGGGSTNTACGDASTVSGGISNTASAEYSTVSGGRNNKACATNSSISGGRQNFVNARHGSINGGHYNVIQSPTNECCSRGATIGGGIGHNTSYGAVNGNTGDITGTVTCCNAGRFSTIGGGFRNIATGSGSTVGGGSSNIATGSGSTVGGGSSNSATQCSSTIGGGSYNCATGINSTVSGGIYNCATGISSTVSGGGGFLGGNVAIGDYSTIGGGGGPYFQGNTASGCLSIIGGGSCHTASGVSSTIGGGFNNITSACYSTVSGGYRAKASRYGEVAHAAGRFAQKGDAQHSTFVARKNTTDATANVELFLDGSSQRMTLTAETTWTFDIKLSAYNDTDNTTAWWIIRGGIRRNAANGTALIGSLIEERDYEGTMSGTSAAVTADDTNESLKIAVTGLASKNIRWVAVVDVAQVSWGTP